MMSTVDFNDEDEENLEQQKCLRTRILSSTKIKLISLMYIII